MKFYVFAKPGARGGALLMAGSSIRDAMLKLEAALGARIIMGRGARRGAALTELDARFLSQSEMAALEEAIESGDFQ